MTKREARQHAYVHAGGACQDAADGWELPYDEDDDEKVRAELRDISQMLFRRGGGVEIER